MVDKAHTVLYTIALRVSQRKKSMHIKSGDCGGHSTGASDWSLRLVHPSQSIIFGRSGPNAHVLPDVKGWSVVLESQPATHSQGHIGKLLLLKQFFTPFCLALLLCLCVFLSPQLVTYPDMRSYVIVFLTDVLYVLRKFSRGVLGHPIYLKCHPDSLYVPVDGASYVGNFLMAILTLFYFLENWWTIEFPCSTSRIWCWRSCTPPADYSVSNTNGRG